MLGGRLVDSGELRYSPAGVPILEFRFAHESVQAEGGGRRQVELEVRALALAEPAQQLSRLKPGTRVTLAGFLARKSRMSQQLVLHVNSVQQISE